jgi:hypothetical protein
MQLSQPLQMSLLHEIEELRRAVDSFLVELDAKQVEIIGQCYRNLERTYVEEKSNPCILPSLEITEEHELYRSRMIKCKLGELIKFSLLMLDGEGLIDFRIESSSNCLFYGQLENSFRKTLCRNQPIRSIPEFQASSADCRSVSATGCGSK